MYEHLVYDDFVFATPAQVEPKLYERTLTMNGVSKAYCMTGWRIGYAGGPRAVDQGDGEAAVAIDVEPVLDLAMGGGRGARRAAGFHPAQQRQVSRSAATSSCRCSTRPTASSAPSRKARSMSIRPAPAPSARPRRRARSSRSDEDFVTELLEAEGVAVVQGAAFGLGAGLPHLLRDQDRGAGRGLPPHPALLRQFEISNLSRRSRFIRGAAMFCLIAALSMALRAHQPRKRPCSVCPPSPFWHC